MKADLQTERLTAVHSGEFREGDVPED